MINILLEEYNINLLTMKQIVINFSDLNDEAKKKYIKFLAEKQNSGENQSLKKSTMP